VSLFGWLRTAKPHLDATQQQRLEQLLLPVALGDVALRSQRWVVLDLETSGLNLNRDQVLSIGAVVIEDGAVDFSQMFERTLQRAETKLNPAVLIHGLGPSAIAAGSDPVDALLDFMDFVGDSPLLAFHAPFDQHMLGRALKDSLGYRLAHSFLDVADIAPLLDQPLPPTGGRTPPRQRRRPGHSGTDAHPAQPRAPAAHRHATRPASTFEPMETA